MNSHFAEFEPNLEPLGAVSSFVDDFIEAVNGGTFLKGFSHQETRLLTQYLECFGVPRHTTVLHEGDEADFLAILVTGQAVITKRLGSEEKVIFSVMPGDVIGVGSMIDGTQRFESCTTVEPSDFAVLSKVNFHSLLTDHPRLSNKFLMRLITIGNQQLRSVISSMLPSQVDFIVP